MAYCKTCQATDAALFYASIKTYCKDHWKAKVRANRVDKIEHYRSFDNARASMPHRVAARKQYRQTPEGKLAHVRATKAWIARHPDQRKANIAVGNALRNGALQKHACLICGEEKVEAHHPDYSRPLDVVWLCEKHHKETHWKLQEAA